MDCRVCHLVTIHGPIPCHLSHLSSWLSSNHQRAEAALKQHFHELWSPLEERLHTCK